MATLASILPFLAALKKSTPDFSGMTSDPTDAIDMGVQAQAPPAAIDRARAASLPPMGPPAPPDDNPQPDLSLGAPKPAPQPPANPVGDITQSMTQDQSAPKFQETKGHLLMRLLQGGLQGGLNGMAANAQTYAMTGRNAGFGGGFGGAQTFPLGVQRQQLENQQLLQMLPFLRAQQIAGLQVKGSEAQKNIAEAQAIPIKAQLEQAQAEAANYKEDPNLGLIDLRTRQPVNPAGLAPLTAEEAQVLGKQAGERVPLKLKNIASEIVNRGYTTVNTEEGVYERNRGTGSMTRLGSNPRMMFAPGERYTFVSDPNNPSVSIPMKFSDAAAQGMIGPQSASVGAARAEAKSEVPTKIGDQKVAFNTMIQHAQLLRQAAKALNNGDVQALNGLKNQFKNQFGYSGPITAEAIADAYKGEVSNVINKGHITDVGNEKVAHTLDPTHQNYATIDSVLGAYQALAQSKLNMLTQQANAAKGQFTVTDPAGGIHTFKDQKSADDFKAAIGMK